MLNNKFCGDVMYPLLTNLTRFTVTDSLCTRVPGNVLYKVYRYAYIYHELNKNLPLEVS